MMKMKTSISVLLLAFQGVSSFTPISLQTSGRVKSRTVQKAAMIDLSSLLNITSLKNGYCDDVMFEKGIKAIKQSSAFAKPETKENDFEVSSEIFEDLRLKSIKELKLVCSKRSITYKGLEEHEEFVQAIVKDINDLKDFSVSGYLVPGAFNEVSGDILEQEMDSSIPLLLDVYATFCGPCKLVETEFEVAARRLGKNCRVAKLDSQLYPDIAKNLQVQGLPATILFHKGRVVSRREGLVSRDQLMDFVDTFVPKKFW
ncbi:unnamed protein product [Cylindrotheca closterium]|uniref:Thioredoxin domain-containing protein n=1 Tax=Cylindrotheca closterium TaxID=2856 RepID=A0AAD2CLF6_9STRA|nr:unnamed protein product [Cylindrotheca closterium]